MTESFARPSPRLDRALDIARIVHDGAVRKGTEIPYIQHPVAVAQILEGHGYGEDLVVAGPAARHGRGREVRRSRAPAAAGRSGRARAAAGPCGRVGVSLGVSRVPASRVRPHGVRPGDGGDGGQERREAAARLAGTKEGAAEPPDRRDAEEAALKAADALHNIECTLRDLRRAGLGVLDRFRGGALVTWHYSAVAQLTSERMPGR